MNISQVVNQAIAHHQAGRLRQAEVLYRQVLQAAPNHPAALNYLGMLAYQAGQTEDAISLMARSIGLAPDMADFRHNYAVALRKANRLAEATDQWRAMLKLKPNSSEAHQQIATCLHMMGRQAEAIDEYRAALSLKENADDVRHNLGLALMESGDLAGALECFDRVLARLPRIASAHNARGSVLRRLGRFDEALAANRRAIELAPQQVEPHVGLGNVLKDMNRLEEAVAAYQRALAIDPAEVAIHNNLGSAYQKLGRWDEALATYERAIDLLPQYAESHWNRSMVLLLQGDFERGWPELEWRFKCRDFPGGRRLYDAPRWEGVDSSRSPAPDDVKSILMHAEQGLGDTIQFVRYAAGLKRLGYKVIVESPPELADLLRSMKEIDKIVDKSQQPPEFDAQAPMLSMPALMRTTPSTIPADVPYLFPDPARVGAWRGRLKGDGPAIGLVWAGSPRHPNDRNRSIRLEMLGPLLAVRGVRFFSLQKGPARDQPGSIGGIIDLADELPTLPETAAAVSALDLVITVDTLMAHLAGALARPVWTLLPFDPDWRWLLGRDDSPWYPTMRLFRQKTAGDWTHPIARIAEAAGLL